jgi:hypothetical protein
MSFQAMTWAVEQKLPALQKLVLMMLANRTNSDTGCCIPRVKLLAADCGMGETATKSALKALEVAGLIEVQERFKERVQLSNQYHLRMPLKGGSPDDEGGTPNDPGSVVTRPRGGRQAPTESGSEPVNKPTSPQGGKAVATRLPSDWALTPELREWAIAKRPDLNVDETADAFRDYWTALPDGKDAKKADWEATWRTWVRKERAAPQARQQQGSGETAYERRMREKMQQWAPGAAAKAPGAAREVVPFIDMEVSNAPRRLG